MGRVQLGQRGSFTTPTATFRKPGCSLRPENPGGPERGRAVTAGSGRSLCSRHYCGATRPGAPSPGSAFVILLITPGLLQYFLAYLISFKANLGKV